MTPSRVRRHLLVAGFDILCLAAGASVAAALALPAWWGGVFGAVVGATPAWLPRFAPTTPWRCMGTIGYALLLALAATLSFQGAWPAVAGAAAPLEPMLPALLVAPALYIVLLAVRHYDQAGERVSVADVVGLPRQKQAAAHRLWAVPAAALAAFGLVQRDTPLTHTALHRLLSHALLFRPLLADAPFLGLISCRDVGTQLQALFGVREVRWYGVRGERDEPGPVAKRHFPDGFDELRRTLTVPFPGALFLVGAGAFGKIYCHWIKDRGGIAIDIGGQFDAWAGVGRGRHAARSLDAYRAHPRISRAAAVERYNGLLDQFALDCPRASAANLPTLPASW